jgi:hypothetical protein
MKGKIFTQAGVLIIALTLLFTSVVAAQFNSETHTNPNTGTQSRDVIFEDGFETYDDFVIEFPPWTTIDVNGDPTFGQPSVVICMTFHMRETPMHLSYSILQ